MKEKSIDKEKFKWKYIPKLLWNSAVQWNKDDVWQLSAAVAYYAILSLPGLLVILIYIIGHVWEQDVATGRLTSELSSMIGYDAADELTKMLQNARLDKDGWIANLIGISTLAFAATGVFYQLQLALNKIWKLKINPKTPWWKILTDRAKSFGFILVIGFLSLISFVASAVISILQNWIENNFADYLGSLALAVNFLLSLSIISFLFGLMFRFLPDANVRRQDIWPGALLTGILFELGKLLLGMYFSHASPGSAYGAAGIVILILLWVSYSCLILFFGAEFIKSYADRFGHGIIPSSKALKFKEELIITEKGDEVTDEDVKNIVESDDNKMVQKD
ncbi:MAG: YihY/virulence factor BrkB family protein [Nonlabens sp.]